MRWLLNCRFFLNIKEKKNSYKIYDVQIFLRYHSDSKRSRKFLGKTVFYHNHRFMVYLSITLRKCSILQQEPLCWFFVWFLLVKFWKHTQQLLSIVKWIYPLKNIHGPWKNIHGRYYSAFAFDFEKVFSLSYRNQSIDLLCFFRLGTNLSLLNKYSNEVRNIDWNFKDIL